MTPESDLGEYNAIIAIATGGMTLDEHYMQCKGTGKRSKLRKQLASLMALVANCADVIATTARISNTVLYKSYKSSIAKAVVLDEAGAMVRADMLMVVANTTGLTIRVGDDKLSPSCGHTRYALCYDGG